jgi:hypothetical protein
MYTYKMEHLFFDNLAYYPILQSEYKLIRMNFYKLKLLFSSPAAEFDFFL